MVDLALCVKTVQYEQFPQSKCLNNALNQHLSMYFNFTHLAKVQYSQEADKCCRVGTKYCTGKGGGAGSRVKELDP